jgi:ABC-type transporter Mla subunit MlaD
VRRVASIALLLAALGALGTLLIGSSAQGSSTSHFDVIFDDARGLISGQLVKVAGATAGTIEDVKLTPDFKARIQASIDTKFLPFYSNGECTIRPQGLIAENYVDCDPGHAAPGVHQLLAEGGNPPKVPVTQTTEPVSLLDLFNMFNLPARQRFALIVNELGIGTSGRGQDFNDILRRANPALALARQVIGILARQKAELATIVDATNTIAAEGASHTTAVQTFLDRAAALSTLTANHASNLSLAINRLPGLLSAAQPALQQLDAVAVAGTPLVQQIHAAVPSLNKVANDLGPFVKVAKPGLQKLGVALQKAVPAIRTISPLVKVLRTYASKSLPSTQLMGKLFVNLQRHGFLENFLTVFYGLAALTARYDSTSHLGVAYFIAPPNLACANYATTPVAGCSSNFSQTGNYTPTASRDRAYRHTRAGHSASTAPAASGGAPLTAGSGGAPAAAANPRSTVLGRTQQLAQQVVTNTQKLLSSALQGAGQATGGLLQPPTGRGKPPNGSQALKNLVSYLLK